jgi:hypothetical protein
MEKDCHVLVERNSLVHVMDRVRFVIQRLFPSYQLARRPMTIVDAYGGTSLYPLNYPHGITCRPMSS